MFNKDLWESQALQATTQFLKQYPEETLTCEQVREYAYLHGLDMPPDQRNWGPVLKAAEKLKCIVCVDGQLAIRNGGRGLTTLWRKGKKFKYIYNEATQEAT